MTDGVVQFNPLVGSSSVIDFSNAKDLLILRVVILATRGQQSQCLESTKYLPFHLTVILFLNMFTGVGSIEKRTFAQYFSF